MAATSSCIVLIEDLKTGGAPGVSAFGGAWTGDGAGGAEGGLGCTGGLEAGAGAGPPTGLSADLPAGEVGKAGEAGAGLTSSFIGRLGGIDPKAGPGIGPPAGGILICGLIGLDPPRSDGFVGSAMQI